jgi:hypothetical protein
MAEYVEITTVGDKERKFLRVYDGMAYGTASVPLIVTKNQLEADANVSFDPICLYCHSRHDRSDFVCPRCGAPT